MTSDYLLDTGAFKELIIKDMRLLKSWERVDIFTIFENVKGHASDG